MPLAMAMSVHVRGLRGRVRAMKPLLSGVIVGVLVFVLLLFAFASGTGLWELLLWAIVAVAAGAVTSTVLRRSVDRP